MLKNCIYLMIFISLWHGQAGADDAVTPATVENSGGPAGETAKENKDGNTTSLKCYNCDSCEKPSDNQTKENCGSCRKYIKSGKVQRYECSDKQGCGDLKDQKGDDKTECCSDKNLCNSTGKNKINTILLGSTISLVLIALFENTIFS